MELVFRAHVANTAATFALLKSTPTELARPPDGVKSKPLFHTSYYVVLRMAQYYMQQYRAKLYPSQQSTKVSK